MSLAIFILMLSTVIVVHEFGHFIAARCTGVYVEEFSLGMGPLLLSKKGRPNEYNEYTLYALRLFPIGGYCKMRGETACVLEDYQKGTSLTEKKPLARLWVMINGSLFNMILAFLAFVTCTVLIGFPTMKVDTVLDGSPAFYAGIKQGDVITHINGNRISLWEDMQLSLILDGTNETRVTIVRDKISQDILLTPVMSERGIPLMGVSTELRNGIMFNNDATGNSPSVGEVLVNSFDTVKFNISSQFQVLGRLINKEPLPDDVGVTGIVGMASQVSNIYDITIATGVSNMIITMILLVGIISTAVGLMNLLPFPALDGARVLFVLIEMVRGKPIKQTTESFIHSIGFAILITFTIIITFVDISKLF